MATTKNDELLSAVGVKGRFQDPCEAYAAAHGTYNDEALDAQAKRALGQAPSTVSPFKMSGGS